MYVRVSRHQNQAAEGGHHLERFSVPCPDHLSRHLTCVWMPSLGWSWENLPSFGLRVVLRPLLATVCTDGSLFFLLLSSFHAVGCAKRVFPSFTDGRSHYFLLGALGTKLPWALQASLHGAVGKCPRAGLLGYVERCPLSEHHPQGLSKCGATARPPSAGCPQAVSVQLLQNLLAYEG